MVRFTSPLPTALTGREATAPPRAGTVMVTGLRGWSLVEEEKMRTWTVAAWLRDEVIRTGTSALWAMRLMVLDGAAPRDWVIRVPTWWSAVRALWRPEGSSRQTVEVTVETTWVTSSSWVVGEASTPTIEPSVCSTSRACSSSLALSSVWDTDCSARS